MSRQRTMEQERATAAWNAVQAAKKEEYKEKYSTLARKGATDLQANGLGQTLAFWRAKNEDEHKAIFKHVSNWVTGQLQQGQSQGLLDWVVKTASTEEYRQATSEAMAFLVWLKRFAEAELGDA